MVLKRTDLKSFHALNWKIQNILNSLFLGYVGNVHAKFLIYRIFFNLNCAVCRLFTDRVRFVFVNFGNSGILTFFYDNAVYN